MSPTITTPAMTQAGMILGTAAYMSPEQAKGRAVDKRSDVWAFGCVFFEMLTGTRAFEGEDVTDTIAAVVRGEPHWRALPADVPEQIRLLLTRCLEKDRKARISDVGVARFLMTETMPTHAAAAAPQPLWKWAVPAVVTALVVAGLTSAAWWYIRPSPPSPTITRFPLVLPPWRAGGALRFLTNAVLDSATAPITPLMDWNPEAGRRYANRRRVLRDGGFSTQRKAGPPATVRCGRACAIGEPFETCRPALVRKREQLQGTSGVGAAVESKLVARN